VDKSKRRYQVLLFFSRLRIRARGGGRGGPSTRPPFDEPLDPNIEAYRAFLESLTPDEMMAHARWLIAEFRKLEI